MPFLGAYACSKAALDALALSYAGELARWGIETTIIVPGALGPGHYLRSGRPRDAIRAEEYADGPTADIARAVADVVELPFGRRPLRIHFDPDDDGAAAVEGVVDRARAELLQRIGLEDILKPAIIG